MVRGMRGVRVRERGRVVKGRIVLGEEADSGHYLGLGRMYWVVCRSRGLEEGVLLLVQGKG